MQATISVGIWDRMSDDEKAIYGGDVLTLNPGVEIIGDGDMMTREMWQGRDLSHAAYKATVRLNAFGKLQAQVDHFLKKRLAKKLAVETDKALAGMIICFMPDDVSPDVRKWARKTIDGDDRLIGDIIEAAIRPRLNAAIGSCELCPDDPLMPCSICKRPDRRDGSNTTTSDCQEVTQ